MSHSEKITPEQVFSNPDFNVEAFIHHVRLYTDYGGRDLAKALCNEPGILMSIIASDDYELAERHVSSFSPEMAEKIKAMGVEVWTRATAAGSFWCGFCLDDDTAVHIKHIKNQSSYLKVNKGPGMAAFHTAKWHKEGMRKPGDESVKVVRRNKPGTRPIDAFRKATIEKLEEIGCCRSFCHNGKKPQLYFYTQTWGENQHRIMIKFTATQRSVNHIQLYYEKNLGASYLIERNEFINRRAWKTGKGWSYCDDDMMAQKAIDWLAYIDPEVKKLQDALEQKKGH